MGQNRLPAVSGAISHFFDSANGHRLRFNDGQYRLLMKKDFIAGRCLEGACDPFISENQPRYRPRMVDQRA